MLNIIQNPPPGEWAALLQRPTINQTALFNQLQPILQAVQTKGDEAVLAYTQQFDGVANPQFKVSTAGAAVSADLKQAIDLAFDNIWKFHEAQLRQEAAIATMPGVDCWRKSVGIQKVGLYIPGGTAPLFSSLLMLGIPARIAGCQQIVVCTPPDKISGKIHPGVLYIANKLNIDFVYAIGGAQAIAAMAYGTATVPKVYKIFGPGNQYVTGAKMLVSLDGLAIDMPAGPSEVAVLADETCVPAFVAADLLSQAEHGIDSQVLLIATDEKSIKEINHALQTQLAALPRKDMAAQALQHAKAILVQDKATAIAIANEYAAEHLIIACVDAPAIAQQIVNAGSVFIGNYSPESVGDYASGTNHTLPTNGFAKAFSGVSVDSFVKKITYQQLSQQGLAAIAHAVVTLANNEGLAAHAAAVTIRTANTA
jgi:histidinol dehydrogenase